MILSAAQVTKSLVDEIKSWPFSVACWEGGSAANKRSDQYSDLDLVICVEDGNTEEAFAKIQDALRRLSPIDQQWRVPEPTWHGHSQCFYKLADTPEYYFLDVVVMQEKATQKFLEKERHGTPVVHFDKKGFVQITSADTPEFWSKMEARRKAIEASFPFFKILIQKEIARKRPIDAMAFYRTWTNFLVELWGMKYRPLRYDFGLRYTHIDFPKDVQAELEKFCYVSSLSDIQNRLPEIELRLRQLLKETQRSS